MTGGLKIVFSCLKSTKKITLVIYCMMLCVIIISVFYRSAGVSTNSQTEDEKFKEYTGFSGKFTYKLPLSWKTSEQKFAGNEILYHNDFASDDKKIRGFVQIWNINIPLSKFISDGNNSLSGTVSFKYYTIEQIKINGLSGYLLKYSKEVENKKYTKAFEVFVMDKGDTFYRFAFYMDENDWKDEYHMYFLNIAASADLK